MAPLVQSIIINYNLRAAKKRHARTNKENDAMPIKTPVCTMFGIEKPIILAGMGGVA